MISDTKTRKVHSASFKVKVALEAVRGTKTLNEVGQEYGVHPVQVSHWKKTLLDKASEVFAGKRGPQAVTEHGDPERLYSEIGRLKMELDWLKKLERQTRLERCSSRALMLLTSHFYPEIHVLQPVLPRFKSENGYYYAAL